MLNSPDERVIPQEIAKTSDYRLPSSDEDPIKEAARPPVLVVRKLLQDERGGFKTGVVIGLGIGAVLFLSTLLTQVTYNQGKDQGRLEALQTPTPAITATISPKTTEQTIKEPILEMTKPYVGPLASFQGEITILPSDNFKPSKTNEKMLSENRTLPDLVAWENIVEIEGVPIKDAEMLKVKNPVLVFTREKKRNTNSYNNVLEVKLNAVILNLLGHPEKRDIFLPINSPESQGFVNGYSPTDRLIGISKKGDQFVHQPVISEKNLGQIAVNQVEAVNTR